MIPGPSTARADVRSKYVGLTGGLDITTQRLLASPGSVRQAKNFLPLLQGGYRRIGGYERFDGRARPSDAAYTVLPGTFAVSLGSAVNGLTSGATATVCHLGTGWIAVTLSTGNFLAGETLRVGVTAVGTVAASDTSVITGSTDNTIKAAAAGYYRALIGAVPGVGAVLGVVWLNGVLYALRNRVGGAAADLYKATSSGWVQVPLFYEVGFTGANTTAYIDGSTLMQGGVTATVKRAVLEGGAWGSAGSGRLIITAPSGGNFSAGSAAGAGSCTLSGAQTAIALLPNGRFRFDVGAINSSSPRAYGCDGVNKEFEFDGEVWVPLNTGMTTRAQCVVVHSKHLFFAYGKSLQNSSIMDPYRFSAVTGANELNALSRITNLRPMGGDENNSTLLVTTESSFRVLYGTSSGDFKMSALSLEAGARADSAQEMGGTLVAGVDGVRTVRAHQAFDNFAHELTSNKITGWFSGRTITDSTVMKARSWYWIFFDGGEALVGGPVKGGVQWMPVDLGKTVRCVTRALTAAGERHFFGSDDGFVYEMEVGRSFDGNEIEAFLVTHPFAADNPALLKTWRSLSMEAQGDSYFELRLQAVHDYGSPDTTDSDPVFLNASQAGAVFDSASQWDGTVYDGAGATRLMYRCTGLSAAIEINLLTRSSSQLPMTVSSHTINYTPRRAVR